MRVSDTERQRTVEELRRHCAAGRIDMDEYGRRIEKAMAAERLEELDAVLSDLPILRIADPSAPGESPRKRKRDSERRTGQRVFEGIASLRSGASPTGGATLGDGALGDGARRSAATFTALLALAVVVAAVVLVIAVSWTWAAVLVAGWGVGLLQSAVGRRRRG